MGSKKKGLDWKEVGQLVSFFLDVFTIVRDTFKKMKVGIEIIPWLIGEGRDFFIESLKTLGKEFLKHADSSVRLAIDYGLSLAELVTAGHYDWVNSDIKTAEWTPPVRETGKVELAPKIIHFNRRISSEDAVIELEKMGLRPGTHRECLVYGAQFPEEQRKRPIVALGSSCVVDGRCIVLYLLGGGSERGAHLHCWGGDWHERCGFLAFAK